MIVSKDKGSHGLTSQDEDDEVYQDSRYEACMRAAMLLK